MLAAFATIGFVPCENGSLVAALEKIVIYGKANGDWTHAARQLADGSWTSKLGGREDIRHFSPDDLVCEDYEQVVGYLMRRRK
jgi:hypothetical protein